MLVAGFLAGLQPAEAANFSCAWNDGSANWTVVADWNTCNGTFPDNTAGNTYNATVDKNNSTVTVDSPITINNLTVGAGNTIVIPNGKGLTTTNYTLQNLGANIVKDGGTLLVFDTFENAGGTNTVQGGGSLTIFGSYKQLSGTTTVGGTLVTPAYTLSGGTTTTQNSGILSSGTFTNKGVNVVLDGGALTASGGYTQTIGDTEVTGMLTSTTYTMSGGNATVFNGGTLSASGAFTNSGITTVMSGGSLMANGGYTQKARSTVVAGKLTATDYTMTGGDTIVSAPGGLLSVLGTFQNNGGATTVQNGSSLRAVFGGYTQNSGTTKINGGGTVTSSTFTVNGGTAQVDGLLETLAANVKGGGKLFGTGKITGDVNNAGAIFPGDIPLPGVLSEVGTYKQTNTGIFDEAISSPTVFSQLLITGGASLNGILDISLLDGFIPALGDTFEIIKADSVGGTFSTVNGLVINPTEEFTVTYNPTDVILAIQARAIPEPGSLVLLGTGLGMIFVLIRGSRKSG